jgi:nicotinamidase-related amidase
MKHYQTIDQRPHMNKYLLRAEDCMLLVVDIQQRLFVTMEEGFKETFLKNGIILMESAKGLGLPIVVTEQYPKGLGVTIDEVGAVLEEAPRYEKLFFSCYRDQGIQQAIDGAGRKTVIVSGIETHVCVFQTVVDLLMAGYRVVVASDAVCSRKGSDRLTALDEMARAGALVYSTEMIAFMLLEKAGTEAFKKLSPLFR